MNKLMVLSLSMVLSTCAMADDMMEMQVANSTECVSEERKVQENNDVQVVAVEVADVASEVTPVEVVEAVEAEASERMVIAQEMVEVVAMEVAAE